MILFPDDIIQIIFEFLRFDRNALFSCILMNRSSSRIAISLLWKNPFMIDNNISQYQYSLLMRTYMSCFSDIEKNYLKNKNIIIRNFQRPIFDYACYLENILYNEPIHESILYWILSEYRNYNKSQLNCIRNVYQFKESYLQYPLINSLYHMFFNKGRIKSLGISINTIKIMDLNDRAFFDAMNILRLSNLTIYLKDNFCNESKEKHESFDFLLENITKECLHIKHIRILNLLVFTNQQRSLFKIQKLLSVQQNLKKLEFFTPEQNIAINEILSSLKDCKLNYLTELELQGTDLSIESRLEGLAYIQSLKSLALFRCKGVSVLNIRVFNESLIVLKKLKFNDNEFSLGLVCSTIGKSLKELRTNQLDNVSTEIIINYCLETLTKLYVKVNLSLISQNMLNYLLKKSKFTHLKVSCSNYSSHQFLKSVESYLPKNLAYLGLFTFKGFNVEDIKCLFLNNKLALKSLEIFDIIDYNQLDEIINYIKMNTTLNSLIIDNIEYLS